MSRNVDSTPAAPFRNAVCFANGKGGAGKTSTTANIAGQLAQAGFRILVMDLDPQGDLSRDLGYEKSDGADLFDAFRGRAIPVLSKVRENLDVVPGGREMSAIGNLMSTRNESLAQGLGGALAPIADDYDFIFIDTPPGDVGLTMAAMEVSQSVVVVTPSDDASLDGVVRTVENMVEAIKRNPTLQLAGVVLFSIGSQSRRIERNARNTVQEMLKSTDAQVFRRRIRHMQGAANDARRRGLLIHELEPLVAQSVKEKLAALKEGRSPQQEEVLYSTNAAALADDYGALAEELVLRLREIEEVEEDA